MQLPVYQTARKFIALNCTPDSTWKQNTETTDPGGFGGKGRSGSWGSAHVAVHLANVIEGDAVLGEQTAVHDQHPAVQAVRQGQVAEHLSEQLHQLPVVLRLHLQHRPAHCHATIAHSRRRANAGIWQYWNVLFGSMQMHVLCSSFNGVQAWAPRYMILSD